MSLFDIPDFYNVWVRDDGLVGMTYGTPWMPNHGYRIVYSTMDPSVAVAQVVSYREAHGNGKPDASVVTRPLASSDPAT